VTGDRPDEPGRRGRLRPYLTAPPTPAGTEPPATGATGGGQVGALRPFLLTSGRVPSGASIAIEAQVVATDRGGELAPWLVAERRDIVESCFQPLSVAEVAARVGLHLGVVRLLVEDLAAEGLLSVHRFDVAASTDVDTLLRVVAALKALR
jgi:hypothetical protein